MFSGLQQRNAALDLKAQTFLLKYDNLVPNFFFFQVQCRSWVYLHRYIAKANQPDTHWNLNIGLFAKNTGDVVRKFYCPVLWLKWLDSERYLRWRNVAVQKFSLLWHKTGGRHFVTNQWIWWVGNMAMTMHLAIIDLWLQTFVIFGTGIITSSAGTWDARSAKKLSKKVYFKSFKLFNLLPKTIRQLIKKTNNNYIFAGLANILHIYFSYK